MIDLHELYWAAGFLEGEGCFQAVRHKNSKKYSKQREWYGLKLVASQVQQEPLLRLQKLFGGKIYYCKNTKQGINQWSLHGSMAAGLMMTLWTLMSSRRKQQIEEGLIKWKTNKNASQAQYERWSRE